MRLLLSVILLLATFPALAEDGTLNPHEGGIAQLQESLKTRPERAGFICWVVYETQKGGLHAEALDALHSCAESGNAPSMILLSHAYENGLGTERSPERATYWVKQAALQGYSLGQYHYGMALLRGYGVTQDEDEARGWLQRAAEGGSETAAEALAGLGM